MVWLLFRIRNLLWSVKLPLLPTVLSEAVQIGFGLNVFAKKSSMPCHFGNNGLFQKNLLDELVKAS